MKTERLQRQRELAREIERQWRRRRTRQIAFVVAGASFLCAFFMLGRAMMPLVPVSGNGYFEDAAEEEAQIVDGLEETDMPLDLADGTGKAEEQTAAGDGGMSLILLIAAAFLGSVGGVALGVARMCRPEDDKPAGA